MVVERTNQPTLSIVSPRNLYLLSYSVHVLFGINVIFGFCRFMTLRNKMEQKRKKITENLGSVEIPLDRDLGRLSELLETTDTSKQMPEYALSAGAAGCSEDSPKFFWSSFWILGSLGHSGGAAGAFFFSF